MRRLVLLFALAVASAGCSVAQPECRADDECDGLARCFEGRCEVDGAVDLDGGALDGHDAASGGRDDAGSPADASAPGEDAATPGDAGSPVDASSADAGEAPPADAGPGGLCTPVHDGVLTSAELPVVIGVGIRYLSAGSEDSPVPVDLAGTAGNDGVTEWHFESALPGDEQLVMEALPPEGHWFSDEFEQVTYVAALDRDAQTLGAFRRTDDAVLLLGVASADEGYTLLRYDPPVTVLSLPMAAGDEFEVETEVSGTFEGNPYYLATDTYETVVDGAGRVVTNAGAFDVLRVRVHQTVRIPILVYPFELVYESWRYTFLTPCLGQVAYVASVLDETEAEFTEAAEVRRVGIW